MLHCGVLQLPLYIGWGYGWCGMPGIGVCVCSWNNGKDIGMTIRKYCGVIPTLFGCFFGIPSLYVLSFF